MSLSLSRCLSRVVNLICGALLLLSASRVVFAETATVITTFQGGDLAITWDKPDSVAGLLNCDASTANCKPLNRAACGEKTNPATSRDIAISLTKPSTSTKNFTTSSTLHIWFQNGTADCAWSSDKESTAASATNFSEGSLVMNSYNNNRALADSSTPLKFPGDFNGVSLKASMIFDYLDTTFTTTTACGGGVANKVVRLCFGIDADGDGTVKPTDTSSNPNNANDALAWIQFPVDTIPPPKPDTPSLTPGDGRILVRASVGDQGDSTSDIVKWEARARHLTTTDANVASEFSVDCTTWDTYEGHDVVSVSVGTLSADLNLKVPNGQRYAVCVLAIDALGNVGAASTLAFATPHNECDFFECYPQTLKTGYCSFIGKEVSGLWLGLVTLLTLVRFIWRSPTLVRKYGSKYLFLRGKD